MKKLTKDVSVGGQLLAEDIRELAAQGVKTIINNRPNLEAFGQPGSSELEMIATELGLTYHHIPLTQVTQDAVDASTKAYAECPRPVAAFCASGTRSTVMWCFAHVKEQGVDAVLAAAAQAGYQLEQTRGLLTAYAGHGKA